MQLYYFSLTSFAILVIASLKDSHSSIISIKYIPDTYECSPWFTFSIFSSRETSERSSFTSSFQVI